jgi:hypothetical protein
VPMFTLRAIDLVWHEIDGDVVILDSQQSLYLSLSGSGALVWKRLSQGADLAELEALLTETYGISEADAHTDVLAFLQMLRNHDLLQG